MKVKALIWREDRTVDRCVPKKKEIEGKTFRFDDTTYFLDADRVMITWETGPFYKLWRRQYFATYYYIRGVSNPLPAPNFEKVSEVLRDANGNVEYDENGKPKTKQIFPRIVDNGVQGEELASLFNPWFYRIIAAQSQSVTERLQFFMICGILLGIVYVIYRLHNLSVDDIKGLHDLLNGLHRAGAGGAPTDTATHG